MKKFIIIILILILVFFGLSAYLNKVLLPTKFKSLVISTLSKQTGKNVTLKSLEFSFFSGLVLRDLVISDNQSVILSTRRATCTIFIWPIFKKQIIIPSINLQAPYIFLQRRQDKSFNLQDLFVLTKPAAKRSDFSLAVFKLTITNGNILFQDDTLATPFRKEIKNIQLNLQLGLPVKLKFNLTAELANQPPVSINVSGEYKILGQELTGNLEIKDISTREFSAYYRDFGDLVSGVIDLQAQVELKHKLLQVELTASGDNLNFVKENLKAKLDSRLQSKINYNLATKKLEFNGACDIRGADISGLEFLGDVRKLNGKFVFNQNSLVADSVKAELLGVPFEINLGIKDFSTRVLNISTNFDLNILPVIARDKFKFSLLDSASGTAALFLKMHPDNRGVWVVQGSLEVARAGLKLEKIDSPIEEISAKVGFSQQGLNWMNAKFKYKGVDYQSSGTLADFTFPNVKLKLFSPDLSVAADFELLRKKIKIAQLKGKYLDTQFLVSGDIDQADAAHPVVDLNGTINLELSNLEKFLQKSYPAITVISPTGQMDTQFNLIGPLLDFKNCYLQAKSTSSSFSVYGFKATDFSLDFLQEERIAKVSSAYLTFYDGVIQGRGALNLDSLDMAYQLELSASGVDLGKLKNDTVSKHKNIGGIFVGAIKLNGAGTDLNKLDGAGNFTITHGRLGELNLLQGLGKLLLAKDLGNIEFTGSAGDFLLKDRFVYTDRLKITSTIVNLAGPVKVGFDGSLSGALDVEILHEMLPLDGTFKDVTTAIIGKGGKFGVIKLNGTIKDPKYAFKTAVGNIIQGLTDMIFKK